MLKLEAFEHTEQIELKIISQSKFGIDFYNGERYFYASDHTLLHAGSPSFAIHPRTATVSLFMDEKFFNQASVFFNKKSNFEMYFLKSVINAIGEYNEARQKRFG